MMFRKLNSLLNFKPLIFLSIKLFYQLLKIISVQIIIRYYFIKLLNFIDKIIMNLLNDIKDHHFNQIIYEFLNI